MKQNLNHFLGTSLIIFLLTLGCAAQTEQTPLVEMMTSDNSPVEVFSSVIYRTNDSANVVHNLNFSIRNKTGSYIGPVYFIQYEIGENNNELGVVVWENRDGLQQFETRNLSTSFGTISSSAVKIILVAHTICTDEGMWRVPLSCVRNAVFPYHEGKGITTPAGEFIGKLKCSQEDYPRQP
jgi:hypothetical protein